MLGQLTRQTNEKIRFDMGFDLTLVPLGSLSEQMSIRKTSETGKVYVSGFNMTYLPDIQA